MLISITNTIKSILIFQSNFWFRNPGTPSKFELTLESFIFLVILVLGVGVLVFNKWNVKSYKPKNKVLKPAGWGLIIFGISGVIFVLFRSLAIDFLGVRFFLLASFLASLGWVLYFLYLYLKRMPIEAVRYETRKLKESYLKKR